MKQFFLITLLSFSMVMVLDSCKGKSDSAAEGTAIDTTATAQDPSMSIQQPAQTATPGVGVSHYTCSKEGCPGNGNAQGKCTICGSDLVHNQAFHNQAPAAAPTNPGEGQINTTPAQQVPPPAQNAAGVFHFACSKEGCGGGAGAAGKCPKCGGDLAHNQAYHQ